jgi:hypothetical protein
VCRYSGDPDEFTALVHAWLIGDKAGCFDAPMGVLPPEPRLYRMNPDPSGEYGWLLGTAREPGRGVWTGSVVKLVQIGCRECQRVGGRHHPGGCLNADVSGLTTLQFQGDRGRPGWPFSLLTVHAVRTRAARPGLVGGTPGPTLCDINRFARDEDMPSWSVGGGIMGGDLDAQFRGCYLCVQVAASSFPGIPISGALPLAEAFTSSSGGRVPMAGHLVKARMAKMRTRVPAGQVREAMLRETGFGQVLASDLWNRVARTGVDASRPEIIATMWDLVSEGELTFSSSAMVGRPS